MGNHDYAATGAVDPARLGERGSGAVRSLEFALWADLTQQVVRLNRDSSPSLDSDLRMWTFGFSMGTNL